MKNALRKFAKIARNPVKGLFLRDLYNRIGQAEYRSFNRRFYAIEQVTEYLIGAQVPGDYLEFGVYQGTTFIHAYKFMSSHFEDMKFVAFDSFEGLPAPKGIDILEGYTSHFGEGQFACSEEEFLANLQEANVEMEKVVVVKGWFDEALKPESVRDSAMDIDKVAAAWIDCDLYESTVPVLRFLTTRISVGSAILFDDWRCFRNLPNFGQQLACREWLDANPQIKLRDLFSFGWHGQAFTVSSC